MAKNTLTFKPALFPDKNTNKQLYIVFYNSKILVKFTNGKPKYTFKKLPSTLLGAAHSNQYLGVLNDNNCSIIGLVKDPEEIVDHEFVSIRALFGQLPEEQLMIVGRANQIINWATTHHFCGKCGEKTQNKNTELALQCTNCETIYYPTISPAIIVAVVKEGKILLGHSKRFKGKFYSVLAGFLEIGETFEQCVAREVAEESGIKVKNIKYFGSQPWPFPNSMMVGFTAEWAGGNIVLHDEELDDAGWFSPEDMPTIPSTFSIAGKLIEWFKEKYNKS
jgi:NAD+ diphosphatase